MIRTVAVTPGTVTAEAESAVSNLCSRQHVEPQAQVRPPAQPTIAGTEVRNSRPCPGFVVVVSGLPGSDKTTLARRLGADLGLVVVCRDRLGQSLRPVGDALGGDPNRVIGSALDQLINQIIDSVLDAGGRGVVVDSNFNWVPQREAIRSLVGRRRPPGFEIRLWGDPRPCERGGCSGRATRPLLRR